MALVPFAYNLRSLIVRWPSTVLTVLGIAATVAVIVGVLALQQGFTSLFREQGREDIAVFLRQGATNEGDSAFTRERAMILMKTVPQIAEDAQGRRLVSAECYLAVRRNKTQGAGETNVSVRGVMPMSFEIYGSDIRFVEGRNFVPGTDEVIIGSKLANRIEGARMGEILQFNTTPFRVVGIFDHDGPFSSEIWGDHDRISEALERPVYNRVVATLKPDTDWAELAQRMDQDPQVPSKLLTEREYLTSQTRVFSFVLSALGVVLAVIMGIAAVFTATNTMLTAIAARTAEIGILLSMGFRPHAVFLGFMLEALLIGVIGGIVGALAVMPLNGIQTGAMNFQTFTEVAFAFRVTPPIVAGSIGFAAALGVLGGAIPAWRAARLRPTEAMRRG
jgi:putative ABC transport system permease protein